MKKKDDVFFKFNICILKKLRIVPSKINDNILFESKNIACGLYM